ncbi:MAG: 2-oxo acid dehydrogenase subunit E2 [Acidimicrobiia bacterium]|nr:2-oxo acid dehydrogenase subunit E2 [Acidimicrobiia bacterium]
MAHEFRLPDVGEGLTEVTVEDWLVDVGEEVGQDAPLVQVETDKAVVDIPSPFAGILLHQGAAAGETLAVGEILAVVGDQGEEWTPSPASDPAPKPVAPIVGTLPEAGDRLQALPAVRKLASELGVDLADVAGSGPGGRITRDDVLAAGEGDSAERIPMSPVRRAIADRLTRSWREIPHVTTFGSARAERLLGARRELLAGAEGPMPLEALLVALIVPLLGRHPEFNAAVAGSDIVLRRSYNVGIATDTPDGLLLPVVKAAETLSIHELADAIIVLAKSARGRTLSPEQMRGPTFTLSNIGAVGGGYGTPIIPYGTSAILSVGRADAQPVVEDGAPAVGLVLPLSLSYDHRIIDGALGRTFMAAVVAAIEAAELP